RIYFTAPQMQCAGEHPPRRPRLELREGEPGKLIGGLFLAAKYGDLEYVENRVRHGVERGLHDPCEDHILPAEAVGRRLLGSLAFDVLDVLVAESERLV